MDSNMSGEKLKNSRTTFAGFKISKADKELITSVARSEGVTFSTFVHDAAIKAAKKKQRNG
jgi:uncharacterized protein (DUF1778 family)